MRQADTATYSRSKVSVSPKIKPVRYSTWDISIPGGLARVVGRGAQEWSWTYWSFGSGFVTGDNTAERTIKARGIAKAT